MSRQLVVTGGTGFIGLNFLKKIVDDDLGFDKITILFADCPVTRFNKPEYHETLNRLKEKSPISCIDSRCVDLTDDNIEDEIGVLGKNDHVSVVNFAAESHVDNSIENPSNIFHSNIKIMSNVLEFMRKCGTEDKLLFQISTDEVYGSLRESQKMFTLSDCFDPKNPYAASKASCEHLFRSYSNTYGIKGVIFRLSNQFGQHQYPEKMIPHSVRLAVDGKPIEIYGDGEYWRQWSWVGETCSIIRKAIGDINNLDESFFSPEPITFHVADPRDDVFVSNNELVKDYIIPAIEKHGIEDVDYRHINDRPGHDRGYRIESCCEYKADFGDKVNSVVGWYLQKWGGLISAVFW